MIASVLRPVRVYVHVADGIFDCRSCRHITPDAVAASSIQRPRDLLPSPLQTGMPVKPYSLLYPHLGSGILTRWSK